MFGAIAVAGGLLAVLAGLTVNNVLATNLVFQNAAATFSSSALNGADVGLGMATMTKQNGATINVLRAGFAHVTLDGLCVSKTESVAGIPVTIRLTAGDSVLGTNELTAANATFDITSMTGTQQAGQPASGLQLDGRAQLGLATADITTTGPDGNKDINPLDGPTANGGHGWYGIDADQGRIFSVKGTLWNAEIGGPLTLPNLRITVTPGTGTPCDDPSAGYPN